MGIERMMIKDDPRSHERQFSFEQPPPLKPCGSCARDSKPDAEPSQPSPSGLSISPIPPQRLPEVVRQQRTQWSVWLLRCRCARCLWRSAIVQKAWCGRSTGAFLHNHIIVRIGLVEIRRVNGHPGFLRCVRWRLQRGPLLLHIPRALDQGTDECLRVAVDGGDDGWGHRLRQREIRNLS